MPVFSLTSQPRGSLAALAERVLEAPDLTALTRLLTVGPAATRSRREGATPAPVGPQARELREPRARRGADGCAVSGREATGPASPQHALPALGGAARRDLARRRGRACWCRCWRAAGSRACWCSARRRGGGGPSPTPRRGSSRSSPRRAALAAREPRLPEGADRLGAPRRARHHGRHAGPRLPRAHDGDPRLGRDARSRATSRPAEVADARAG